MEPTEGKDPEKIKRSLFYFQLTDMFERAELYAFLNQDETENKFPYILKQWKSSDSLTQSRTLFPPEIVYAISDHCKLCMDLFAAADGETLLGAGHGKLPHRLLYDADGQADRYEDITDARKLTTREAMVEYGPSAVWIVSEYGTSYRGEYEGKFYKMSTRYSK